MLNNMVGVKLGKVLSEEATRLKLLGRPNQPVEAELRQVDGAAIPVELIQRQVDFGGKLQHAIAVRDLRARKKAEQHIRFMAHHDALTGRANRGSFNKRLDQEMNRGSGYRGTCWRFSALTSTGSRKSMISSGTSPAIRCCKTLQRA